MKQGFEKKLGYFFFIGIIIIIALTAIIYSNTFNVPFQFDDLAHIIDNHRIHTLDLGRIFQYSKSRFLLHLSFALNYHFGGAKAFGFHLINLLIHILNCLLVFFLIFWTFKTPRLKNFRSKKEVFYLSFFTALIFATHPIQIESVTYIYQRGEVLSGLFYFLSLFLYVHFRTSQQARLSYFGCLLSAIFCFFTKPNSVTLPIAVFVYEAYFISPTLKELKRNVKYILPVFILSALPFLLARLDSLESKNIGIRFQPAYTPYYYTKLRVLVGALRLLILPINQNLEHDFVLSSSLLSPPTTIFSLLFLVILFVLALFTFRSFAIFSFSIIWFFLMLSITTILYLDDLFFEHYLYLPMFGFASFFPAAALALFKKIKLNLKTWSIGLMLLVLFFCVATYRRNEVWKSEISLWEDTVRKSPNKARSNYILGVYYFKAGRFDEALKLYNKALKLKPDYPEAYYRLGEFYFSKGDLNVSISNFKKAVELKPDFYEALLNLSALYYNKGDYRVALEEGLAAIKARPDDPSAYINVGSCYIKLNQPEEARRYLEKGLQVSFDKRVSDEILNMLKKFSLTTAQ